MTSNSQRTTAKIYQFPAGGRASRLDARVGLPKADLFAEMERRAAKVVYGDSWYHDEAIQSAADLARKH
jgi:hypothetical protein